MYHIAYFKKPDDVVENLEIMHDNLVPEDVIGIAEYKEGS